MDALSLRRLLRATPALALMMTTAPAPIALSVMATTATPAMADDACTPGKTKKIAFMLKQQTAFRYLHADIPFFTKTAKEAGYDVLVQSAESNHPRRRCHRHPAGGFQRRRADRRDRRSSAYPAGVL
jgi:hypothetical protein